MGRVWAEQQALVPRAPACLVGCFAWAAAEAGGAGRACSRDWRSQRRVVREDASFAGAALSPGGAEEGCGMGQPGPFCDLRLGWHFRASVPTSALGGSGPGGEGRGLRGPPRPCPVSPAPLLLSPVPFPGGTRVGLHPPRLCLCDKLQMRTHSRRQSCRGRARVCVTRSHAEPVPGVTTSVGRCPLRSSGASAVCGQLSAPALCQSVEIFPGTQFRVPFRFGLNHALTWSSPRPCPSAVLGAGPGACLPCTSVSPRLPGRAVGRGLRVVEPRP